MSDAFAGLPRHHFGAILIDPPWTFETWSERGKGRVLACGIKLSARTRMERASED